MTHPTPDSQITPEIEKLVDRLIRVFPAPTVAYYYDELTEPRSAILDAFRKMESAKRDAEDDLRITRNALSNIESNAEGYRHFAEDRITEISQLQVPNCSPAMIPPTDPQPSQMTEKSNETHCDFCGVGLSDGEVAGVSGEGNPLCAACVEALDDATHPHENDDPPSQPSLSQEAETKKIDLQNTKIADIINRHRPIEKLGDPDSTT